VRLGIEGRGALVMGASRGIGRAVAASLAGEGASVAIVGRSGERLIEAADSIDGEVVSMVGDAGDLASLPGLVDRVTRSLGSVDILVTNSGGPPVGGVMEHTVADWQLAYANLVLGPMMLANSVVPRMRQRGWGRIVNVGSTTIREPAPGLVLSNAHRMAATGYFKTLSGEVAGAGITVNTVATGWFATERMFKLSGSRARAEEAAHEEVPVGRLGDPTEYGDLVAFLCSERASYLTGAVIPIDGGLCRTAY
jgi:3-oxoacyl-[acyl-carrier protein] reductase